MPKQPSEPKPFDISKYPDVDCNTFALRRLDGHEEVDALARTIMPTSTGGGANPMVMRHLHREQLIAAALCQIDGDEILPSEAGKRFLSFNMKTREFISTAFSRHSGATVDELEDFVSTHWPKAPAPGTPSSSASGSGSPGT